MIDQARDILRGVFGYDDFRPLQKEIIENILRRNDTLVIMPTGGGKSLCYQIPALIFDGLTIVVSPLISLMKDQVEQLTALGVEALFLNSSLTVDEYNSNVANLKSGKVKLLYLAPESLFLSKTLSLLSHLRIDCLTIDEAHCISEWGHDFRPEYRRLFEIRANFPSAVCVALTATATPIVQKDIKRNLQFGDENEFIASFNRENLFLQIIPKDDPFTQTTDFLKRFQNSSGIIYCFSRKQVDALYEALNDLGYSVKPYHAGLSDEERKLHQELFIKDDIQIIVATIAFGMGINKPNIRFVIHYDLPKNIESYYQEIGRAGRDGLKSQCLMLFSYADIQKIKYFINQKNEKEKRVANMHLNALLNFAETDVCRRIPLIRYFGEDYSKEKCNMCDNCLSEKKELTDVTIPAQKFLSCVKRTGEIFGINHIIDVLHGSQSQKVLKFGHQRLTTYGIGKDYPKKQWFYLARQFLQKGLMIQDDQYGSIKLTDRAYDVFKGKELVHAILDEKDNKDIKGKEKENDKDYDSRLFEILRKERKRLADQANIPPYVIFPDKTLIEVATFFPQSCASLMGIYGVGKEKSKKYGQLFIDIIIPYCQENQIIEIKKISAKKKTTVSDSIQKRRHVVIGELYNSGYTVNRIVKKFNIKKSTVIDHLYKYKQEGNPLKGDGLLTLSKLSSYEQKSVIAKFEQLGFDYLSPVFEELNGKISYDELKICRLYYMCKS